MILLEQLTVALPGFAVRDISLQVNPGEFFALLGPTGAGKSVILESIAGLVRATGGRIRVNGRDVTRMPPERRRIGIVYQDYALFPHLTVIDNIRYGLRYHGLDTAEGRRRVEELLGMLGLERIRRRKPLYLSGGEKQRTALARALSINPSVVLLDEPLSALDPGFRGELRGVLKNLHRELGVTFLMVTHNFEETLCLADRVALVRQGRLEQVGTAEEIFRRPRTPFAAGFVGMKNIFPATPGPVGVEFHGLHCPLPPDRPENFRHAALRPDAVNLGCATDFPPEHFTCSGEIRHIINLGYVHEVAIRSGEADFITYLDRRNLLRANIAEGQTVTVGFDPASLHLF